MFVHLWVLIVEVQSNTFVFARNKKLFSIKDYLHSTRKAEIKHLYQPSSYPAYNIHGAKATPTVEFKEI